MTEQRKRINMNALPEYEMKLLAALAFFLDRPLATQAAAALAMYLRQSQDRIFAQVDYYADKVGMSRYELLELIASKPDVAKDLISSGGSIHENETDVFTE